MNIRKSIEASFGEKILKGSIIFAEPYLDGVLDLVQPRSILEIGTLNGISAGYWAQKADRVTTIDVTRRSIRSEIWQSLGCAAKVSEYIAESDDDKRSFINTCEFDFAFIDGMHTGEAVKFDFDSVKHCECVLFHDYKPDGEEYAACPGERYPDIADFIDTLSPDVYVFGRRCSYFALWLKEGTPLRNSDRFRLLESTLERKVRAHRYISMENLSALREDAGD